MQTALSLNETSPHVLCDQSVPPGGCPSLFQSCAQFKTILDIYSQGGTNRSHFTVHRKTNTTGYSFLSFIPHWFAACHCAMSFFVFNQLMYLFIYYCVCMMHMWTTSTMWRSEDSFAEWMLSIHLSGTSGDWTQVSRLVQEAPLPTEPFPLTKVHLG